MSDTQQLIRSYIRVHCFRVSRHTFRQTARWTLLLPSPVTPVTADGPTLDQQAQLQRLMQALKQIETQQKELQAAIKKAKEEREAMFEKERDFFHPSAKEPPAPNMEVGSISTNVLAHRLWYNRACHFCIAGAEGQQCA